MSDGPDDLDIKARQSMAGRFGFVMGCVAAIAALVLNLWHVGRPFSLFAIAMSVLMAALNIPLGIALALFVERVSRSSEKKK